ncbi:hypothetical protein D3C71_655530 [compost metagenome]
MRDLEKIIARNSAKYDHFGEYFKLIDLITENLETHPDICIESCKALIEGVSKTILIALDKTKDKSNIDDCDSVQRLFKDAVSKLAEFNEEFELDYVSRHTGIIQIVAEIRNKRGEVSHGRMAPKSEISSVRLATTISKLTESILVYVLEHFFAIEIPLDEKLAYSSKDLIEYNNWLDESIDFPIKKARYSQVLYDTDYDEYEARYYDDFLKEKETIEQGVPAELEDQIETTEELEIKVEQNPVLQEKIKQIVLDGVEKISKTNFDAEERIGNLLREFALKWKLDFDDLEELYNNFYFSEKPPLRDEIVNIMVTKPENLKERVEIVPIIIKEFLELANGLNILRTK